MSSSTTVRDWVAHEAREFFSPPTAFYFALLAFSARASIFASASIPSVRETAALELLDSFVVAFAILVLARHHKARRASGN